MPVILRNDDAEALILDIRACRTVAAQPIDGRAGAILIFPTSVVIKARAGHSVFPLGSDVEPGTIVTNAGSAQVAGVVAGISVSGFFHWTVGDGSAPPAAYRFCRRGRELPAPAWATQLPSSQQLPCLAPAALARRQDRLRRHGRNAEHWLLALTEQVIRRSCRAPVRQAIRYRPQIDVDDVVQRGLQAASRLLPVYASKDRPPCSWLGMLRLDARRDMTREISRLDWLPADAMAALTVDETGTTDCGADPDATIAALANAAELLGRAMPRIAPAQLGAALRAPALLEYERTAGATVAGPELLAPDDGTAGRPGVTATVARLVSDDEELIGSAAAGDPGALRRVGDQVVRRLSERAETPTLARRRCWEEFQQSGHLFASPTGLVRFGAVADPDSLAAVDECLRRAAGLRAAAGDRR